MGVVVTSFDGGERVVECMAAIYRQTLRPAQVVLVDNASTDRSVQRIRGAFPATRIIELTDNRGPCAARNAGLAALDTELALLTDHDIYLDDDCLTHLVRAQRCFGATVVCPRIRLLPESDIVQADGASVHFLGTLALRHGFMRAKALPDMAAAVGAAPGGCLLVERASVLAAGSFDELIFFYFEDLEFSLRLRALGHVFVCEPAGVVYHDRRSGTPDLAFRGQGQYPARRIYLNCRNRLFTVFVHYRLKTLLVLAPVLLAYELASLCFVIARGSVGAWARAWGWQIRNATVIVERRRRMQALRSVADRDLLAGGPIPLAPGTVRSAFARSGVAFLSAAFNVYWRCARLMIH